MDGEREKDSLHRSGGTVKHWSHRQLDKYTYQVKAANRTTNGAAPRMLCVMCCATILQSRGAGQQPDWREVQLP